MTVRVARARGAREDPPGPDIGSRTDPATRRAVQESNLAAALNLALADSSWPAEERQPLVRALETINRSRQARGRAPLTGVELAAEAGQSQATRSHLITAAELMARELPEPRWIVPGLLPEGLTLLAGKPKQGKSWLALQLSTAVACGGRALGQIPVEQGEVLHLALEDGLRRLQDRLRLLLRDAPAPAGLYLETQWPHLDEGGLLALEDWLAAHPAARFVVIDTLARVRPTPKSRNGNAYTEDYDALAPLQQLATRRHVAVLLVHHLRKMAASDPLDTVSGTTGLTAAADCVHVLTRERSRADAVLHVVGRDIEDGELALQQDREAGGWLLLGNAAEYRLSQERQAILDALREAGKPLTPKELAEEYLNKDRPAVRALLSRMAREGQVHALGGRYSAALDIGVTPVTGVTPASLSL